MTSSLHATISLGTEYSENLHTIRNIGQKPIVQKLFDAIDTLIREQELDISGVSELSWRSWKWEELYLASDKEDMHLMKAKVYVVSRLCIVCGRMHEHPQSIIEWESRLSWLKCKQQYQELDDLAQKDHAHKATKRSSIVIDHIGFYS